MHQQYVETWQYLTCSLFFPFFQKSHASKEVKIKRVKENDTLWNSMFSVIRTISHTLARRLGR